MFLLRKHRLEEILLFLLLSLKDFRFFELIVMFLAADLAAINQLWVKEWKVYRFQKILWCVMANFGKKLRWLVKWVLRSSNSLATRPRYFTSLILSTRCQFILKLRCLVILQLRYLVVYLALDFGLNKIISVLLAFKDILFALSQVFRTFRLD